MGVEFSTAKPDLQAIEVLIPSNDDFLQRKAGAWTNRTIAQVKTDLAVPVASDVAYDATSWDGNTDVPTKNAIRDKIETLGGAGIGGTAGTTDNVIPRADGVGGSTLQASLLSINDTGHLVGTDANALLKLGMTSQAALMWGANDGIIIASGAVTLMNNGNGIYYISNNWTPASDNFAQLGTTTARWKELHVGGFIEGAEMTAPAAPGANRGRTFYQDNGAGKTQYCVIFPTGAVQVIATEP